MEKKDVVQKIKQCARDIQSSVHKRKKPSLSFPKRSLSNVKYNPREGYFQLKRGTITRTLTYNTVRTFAQTLKMTSLAKTLVETEDMITKREAYYTGKNTWGEAHFDSQNESDAIIEDIEAHFRVNREQIGFVPDEHGGAMVGPIAIVDRVPGTNETVRIDCSRFGTGAYSVPVKVEQLQFETTADFVLAIETQGAFQRLVNHGYWRKANCILILMQGVPTRACRRFLRRLSDEAHLPIYAFTDCDPYAFANIYRTLKVGSGKSAHINEFFCVPEARFLGVTPDDIDTYDLPTEPMKDVDEKRALDAIRNDPFFQHHAVWVKAMQSLVKRRARAEQQAFAAHGLNFVHQVYLPDKLKNPKKFLP
jgi:DNA topoisomerase-6 subunit A